jgi:lysophospholipid acyltransferase (LPLAT)-like uncharacterized protein
VRPDPERFARRLRATPLGRRILARIGAALLRFVHATTRWTVQGAAHRDALQAEGVPVLAAFWHGRLFFAPFWAPPERRTVAVMSSNHDGELMVLIAGGFGIDAIRGSSTDPRKPGRDKGGWEAFAAAFGALKRGAVVAITPDGPRGPRMRAQPGVAALSIATGAPVMPIAFSTRRGWLTRSWDSFLIPRPFDEGILIYGEPLRPPPRGDAAAAEAYRIAIEAALTAVTAEADRRMGRTPVAAE